MQRFQVLEIATIQRNTNRQKTDKQKLNRIRTRPASSPPSSNILIRNYFNLLFLLRPPPHKEGEIRTYLGIISELRRDKIKC